MANVGLKLALSVALATLVAALGAPASAISAVPSPRWVIDSFAHPSGFIQGDTAPCLAEISAATCDAYEVTATNVGSKPMSGATVSLTDSLPAGLTVRRVALYRDFPGDEGLGGGEGEISTAPGVSCGVTALQLKCTLLAAFFAVPGRITRPDYALKLFIYVTVDAGAAEGPLTNSATVAGGGAPSASTTAQNMISSAPPPFGFSAFGSAMLGVDGVADTQAGSHPYELATRINLNSTIRETPEATHEPTSIGDLRDVIVDLPPGVVGSALAAPTCTLAQLTAADKDPSSSAACPSDSAIGYIRSLPESLGAVNSPIYNLVPERGVAAEFGFVDALKGSHVLYAGIAPTAGGYILRTTSREITQISLLDLAVSIYGDPAARDGASTAATSMFTNPAYCSGERLKTTIHMDSWQAPGGYLPDGSPNFADPNWAIGVAEAPPVTDCAALEGQFAPALDVRAESAEASSPTGLNVNLSIPQSKDVEALATPPLRDITVTLPEGLNVNPSSANGLAACSEAQIGWLGGTLQNFDASAPTCPDSSKIGTLEVETPALPAEVCKEVGKTLGECPGEAERERSPLEGSIYLARQDENPFGSLIALYFVIDDPRTGVIVKLPAEVKANEATGHLTTIVRESPQFPVSELRTHIFGGNTASLSNPAACGVYPVVSEATPWSSPESGPPASLTSSIEVSQGPSGGACTDSLPFAPSFTAGTADPQGGAFSPLSVSFSRQDSEQGLGSISVTTPRGLLGSLKGVAQCAEPQAARGECGPESLVGEADTAVGAGPLPYWVHGGKVYLTGPYNGGPFGLSIVVPTSAGPFTLTGNAGRGKEVVRSSIRIDRFTSQVTVLSDPVPTIIQGIPLQVRTVNITINRPGFIANPTNCTAMAVVARITSSLGAVADESSPFRAANCASLPFRPTLTASTGAKASKVNGASLRIVVRSGPGQANIAKTALTLPAALPSRLTTIQKACDASVFEANPAACNEGSVIGMATVHTPLLNSTLTGPGYLVSHGSAAFPDVEFVLQGEGITLVLDGRTDIKKGITYSRFEAVPDAPITSFEALLPTGPHSALTAVVRKTPYNLCSSHLLMPTVITGQNGAVVSQTTKIGVSGCATRLTRAQLLAKALQTCRKKPKGKRSACETQARRRYGARRELLAKALKACRRETSGVRKDACSKRARRKYSVTPKKRRRKQK